MEEKYFQPVQFTHEYSNVIWLRLLSRIDLLYVQHEEKDSLRVSYINYFLM